MRIKLIQTLSLIALALGLSSCTVYTPPVQAYVGASDGAVIYRNDATPGPEVYSYYYYPDVDVYFDPGVKVYYWNEGGRWYSGRDLPRRYRVHGDRYVFRTDVRRPYEVHERVIRQYREHRPDYDRDRREYKRDTDRDRYDRDRYDRDRYDRMERREYREYNY